MNDINTTRDIVAPGHRYLERLGTGIKWSKDRVVMVFNDEEWDAPSTHKSEWDYFYNLGFRESFPEVTHWWFHSAWTQYMRCAKPHTVTTHNELMGFMQFVAESETGMPYYIDVVPNERPIMNTPYPIKEVKPVNIPLRMALSNVLLETIDGTRAPEEWIIVTSLVEPYQMDYVFSTEDNLPYRLYGNNGFSHREYLCLLQKIKKE